MQKPSIVSVLPMLMLGTSDQKSIKQVSLIINRKGQVNYQAPDGEEQLLAPGALVRNSGKLHLDKDTSVLLFSSGKYLVLTDEGTHDLDQLTPPGGMKKLNYDGRFSKYLMAALDLVVHAKKDDGWVELSGSKGGGDGWGELSGSKGGGDGWGELSGSKGGGDGYGLSGSKGGGDGYGLSGSKGGGDGYGNLSGSKGGGDGYGLSGSKGGGDGYGLSGSKGGGDGWGDKDGRIVPILPFGKIPNEAVIFQWSQPNVSTTYTLEILDESGSIVHSTQVKDNWAQINLDTLPLKNGEKYAWRIDVPDQQDMASTKVRITLTKEQARDIIEKKLKRSEAYQLEDPVLCGLMEAIVLEEQDHFYEAYQRYEMLRQTHKENKLVKLMQAAFYVRYQLKPRAQLLFS